MLFRSLGLLIAGYGYAAGSPVDDARDQIKVLETRIAQAKEEYVTISKEKMTLQETCNLVDAKEAQMRRLNQMNNDRRAEIILLNQKIKSLTQGAQ